VTAAYPAGNDLLLYIHDVVSVALGAIRPLREATGGSP
jgi:hypothetical protein